MSNSLRTSLNFLAVVVTALSIACGGSQEPAANSANAAKVVQTAPAETSPTSTLQTADVQSSNSSSPAKASAVTIKAKDMTAVAGGSIKLEIEVTSTEELGAMIFTLDFDPAVFKYEGSAISPTAPKAAVLQVNDQQTSTGKLGALMVSTTPFPKGKSTVMTADFQVAPDAPAGEHKFTFSSKPAGQSVSTFKAVLVEAAYVPGIVRIAASR